MVFVAVISLAVLAAESRGPIAVVATSKRPGTEAVGTKVASRVLELLEREGVGPLLDDAQATKLFKDASFPDPRTCNGGQKCVEKLAVLAGPRAVVVSVDVAKLGKSIAIHLEAIGAEGGEPLSSADVSAPIDAWKEQSAVGFITFARALKVKLEERLVDVPRETAKVDPKPKPSPALEPKPKPQPRPELGASIVDDGPKPRIGAWVTAGTGGAALTTSVIVFALAMGDLNAYRSRLYVDETMSEAFRGTEAERLALQQGGNVKFTVALTSAVLGAALGATSAWLFLKKD